MKIKHILKKFGGKTNLSFFLILFLLALILSRTLFTDRLFRTDDLELHGARVANYYLALKQGQLPVYWAPNLHDGFGYPIFHFMYPLPYVVSSFFYAAGFSIELSINLFILFAILSGGLGLYLYALIKTKKPFHSLVASLIYLTAPYTLINIFVRGSLGEIAFFATLPWIFVLIALRKNSIKLWYQILAVVVFSSFLLSHQISLLIAIPIILIWLLMINFQTELKKKLKEKYIQKFIFLSIISILICQFFYLPFLLEKQYTVISGHHINENYVNRFSNFKKLLSLKWGYGGLDIDQKEDMFPTNLGLSSLLIITTSLYVLKTNYKKNFKLLIFWLSIYFAAILLMLPITKYIWKFSQILPYLQYPWRLLWVTVFASCMIFIHLSKSNLLSKKTIQYLSILLLLVSLHHIIFFAKPIGYIQNSDHAWHEYPGTSTSENEHRPKKFDTLKNSKLLEKLTAKPIDKLYFNEDETINEVGEFNILSWTGSAMTYQINTDKDALIIQKTAYFPGWQAWVDDKKVDIKYEDSEFTGRILIPVKAGQHTITVKFTNQTFAKQTGIILSLLGFLLWLLLLLPHLAGFIESLIAKGRST